MGEFLLELFSEEMPAFMMENYAESLVANIGKNLNLELSLENLFTPRRITTHLKNLPSRIEEKNEEIRGPRTNAPEAAIQGFLKKYNIENISKLEQKGDFYFFYNKQPAQDFRDALKIAVEKALNQTTWPKSMLWGDYDIRYVRPLHCILAIFDKEPLDIKFGHLTASNKTFGHRFLANTEIEINSASISEYKKTLQKNYVIISRLDREASILEQIDKIISKYKLKLIQDSKLVTEVANLVEYPVVYLGKIENKFMALPEEVLITSLKANQRYLMLRDQNDKLAPYFIIVSNNIGEGEGKEIIHGNEKVLSARLHDALFFYENDKKTKLESRIDALKKLTFHSELGSVYDRIQSTKIIAKKLCEKLALDSQKVIRTIDLMKADLVTQMVQEFPELQGAMGYYYALNDKEDVEVANAIKEHYSPIGPNDATPKAIVSSLAALADKLDLLNQLFSIGIKPTGSKDPYAQRRAANGIIRIINENNMKIDISRDLYLIGIREDVVKFILERDLKG